MGKTWTKEDVKQALEEVENRSVSIRATAKKYGMTKGALRKQIKIKKETGFLMDPQKLKVIALVGEVGFTTTGGAGRENTTVLGVCNGAGRVLDPLIIFQGKNLVNLAR